MSIDLAVVPVAGRGTRLWPLTKSQPKEMLSLGRKPVVQHVVEELARSHIRRVLFITRAGKSSIENHFDFDAESTNAVRKSSTEEFGELSLDLAKLEFSYTRQRELRGLGHAVLCAQRVVGDRPFVVALGDSIIGLNSQSNIVERMVAEFERQKADAAIAFEQVPTNKVSQYGIAKPTGSPGASFVLADLIEKPNLEEAPSNLAVAARYVFEPRIFDFLRQTKPGKGNEIQLTDAIRQMIQTGRKVIGLRLQPGEKRFDIGNFGSYFAAFFEFALADPRWGDDCRKLAERALGQPVL